MTLLTTNTKKSSAYAETLILLSKLGNLKPFLFSIVLTEVASEYSTPESGLTPLKT